MKIYLNLLILIVIAILITGTAAGSTISEERRATRAIHGQLIFGADNIYLSHLPMFMFNPSIHPHNYQVIMKVNLSDSETAPESEYIADREANPDTRVYTLVPERFSMIDLISNATDQPIKSLKGQPDGTIYRGHFERDGTMIIRDATINVEDIIYSHEFDPEAEKLENLTYLLFGRGDELFMAHMITRPPDFDQVLSVDAVNPALTDEELSHGVLVFFPDRENTLEMRLKEEDTAQGNFVPASGSEVPEQVEVTVGDEIYLESGELSSFLGEDGKWHEVIEIRDSSFQPEKIEVAAGSAVTWINSGGAHTVTEDSGVFDSGIIPSGGKFNFTFADAGTYEYHCDIHPFMKGIVVVS